MKHADKTILIPGIIDTNNEWWNNEYRYDNQGKNRASTS